MMPWTARALSGSTRVPTVSTYVWGPIFPPQSPVDKQCYFDKFTCLTAHQSVKCRSWQSDKESLFPFPLVHYGYLLNLGVLLKTLHLTERFHFADPRPRENGGYTRRAPSRLLLSHSQTGDNSPMMHKDGVRTDLDVGVAVQCSPSWDLFCDFIICRASCGGWMCYCMPALKGGALHRLVSLVRRFSEYMGISWASEGEHSQHSEPSKLARSCLMRKPACTPAPS
ncbi:hypothetical protein NEOLEDRAFT_1141672 [Neolentinus lepideus HHB14362 ss-1]|uniref:Uncharacterized protein n=1 Tax=Neolentinus lepideus HHB14362 ss-1 TaxID=1314782 RepID=A0A165NI82_9AGAM|nr:hypothetical protein NEOLEDRAFT_1141672 [Neolentinus lepideus HHB14362 ss-1]